jgi:hypothetical protein
MSLGLASLSSHGQPATAVNTPHAEVPPPGLTGTLPPPGSAPAPAAPATAPAPARGVIVVEINGNINQDLVHKVRRALEGTDPQRFPAGALLVLNSAGGNGVSAMEIGRIARAARAHAFVRGRCASACTFILAGSVMRGVGTERSVGIHRGRLTQTVKDRGEVTVDVSTNPNAARVLEVVEQLTESYLREMGLPDAFFRTMQAVPPDQTRYLELAELERVGMLGFDPEYRNTRAAAGAAQFRISEEEFVQRTLRVAGLCLHPDTPPSELVRCYRRVLQTGS